MQPGSEGVEGAHSRVTAEQEEQQRSSHQCQREGATDKVCVGSTSHHDARAAAARGGAKMKAPVATSFPPLCRRRSSAAVIISRFDLILTIC